MERIQRNPNQSNIISLAEQDHPVFGFIGLISTAELQSIYLEADHIQIEGCQGYSLSVYHGQYPYVTCRDVTSTSLLAEVGMPLRRATPINIYGVFRTYPIRVANRPASGEWSGPTYPDSHETTFEALGQPQELTTVTRLPRRIFTFSQQQAIEACVQNRVDFAFLNFCQYCPDWATLRDIWLRLEESAVVQYMGFGPRASQIVKAGSPIINEDYIRGIYEHSRAAIRNRPMG
jgi:adenylosuccinate synthase